MRIGNVKVSRDHPDYITSYGATLYKSAYFGNTLEVAFGKRGNILFEWGDSKPLPPR